MSDCSGCVVCGDPVAIFILENVEVCERCWGAYKNGRRAATIKMLRELPELKDRHLTACTLGKVK